MKTLTEEEQKVILDKGTEMPFSGQYYQYKEDGTYVCKRCGEALYRSSDKFDSGCGWPSFDDEIKGAIHRTMDADGRRTEITCAHCGAHLGHVFIGENLTPKNVRHCVNSISLDFIGNAEGKAILDTAIFAGGCFWGVEYWMKKLPGIDSIDVGYIGGTLEKPTYEEVCRKNTGHIEAVRILFHPEKISYQDLVQRFFEIHDPEQMGGQGPDIGHQYISAIFYTTAKQKETAVKMINRLSNKGYKIATKLIPASTFWKAEEEHQNYYENKHMLPYCHGYTKRF
ncbi:MAG: bifunctional methionine sulfoxide reductase B/A protein [Bacteroidales bacterium]